MKEKILLILSVFAPIIIGFVLLFVLRFAVNQQSINQEHQQRLNFLCSPGVYLQTISNKNNEYIVCLMKQDSKEFEVREIVK